MEKENKQEEQVENKSSIEDRHLSLDPYSNLKDYKDLSKEEIRKEDARLPTVEWSRLKDYTEYMYERLALKDFQNNYSPTDKQAVSSMLETNATVVRDGVFQSTIDNNKGNFVNDLKYGDSSINIREAKFSNQNGKITGASAVARFNAMLSVGAVIHVPLWHSGFCITLRPPTQREIINLELNITSNAINLGRDTNNMVFSNYSVVFNKIVMEFIINHIVDHTVKIDQEDDITKYILVNDLYPLIMGILAGMNPKGLNVTRTCNSVAIIDEENKKSVCDYVVSAICNPSKLVWVNRKALTTKMLNQMSKKLPNSITIQDVKEYQNSLSNILEKVYTINTDAGTKFNITLKAPTIYSYIEKGEEWVERIINNTQDLFTESDTDEVKNDKINKMLTSALLSIYNSYFSKISIPENNIEATDEVTITQMLDGAALDDTAYKEVLEAVQEYISNSAISIVATPAFTCPKCKTAIKNEDIKEGHPFEALIPINVLEVFFGLCVRRNRRLQTR